MPLAADAPSVTAAGGELLRELVVLDEGGERRAVHVPMERPLSIVLDARQLVTLMTLGAAPALLALGYLRNQCIIERVTEIESIHIDWAASRAQVLRRPAVEPARAEPRSAQPASAQPASAKPEPGSALGPARLAGTACGLGTEFGDLMRQVHAATVPSVGTMPRVGDTRIARAQLLRILDVTREYDAIHRAAGSVHGCALFAGADLLVSIEDVSRHNGLDTVTGWMMLYGVEGGDKTLFTTGRLTGEMVMKAAHNGISIVISRNGVTSMGYELASKLGMVLFGRAAKGRYLCYAGAARFDSKD